MIDNEVLDLLQRKHTPLSIDQVIEILETKIKWCESAEKIEGEIMAPRIRVEATTLNEALAIVKRINQRPLLFFSARAKVVRDFEEWAHKEHASVCFENFLIYLDIIGYNTKEMNTNE